MVSTPEQRKRYRDKYPEKIKQERMRYLDRKLKKRVKENPKYLDKLKGKILNEFAKLTRLMYTDKLQKECSNCGDHRDLQIHHERYVYPIIEEDLVVLCRRCHTEEHQKIPTPKEGETP